MMKMAVFVQFEPRVARRCQGVAKAITLEIIEVRELTARAAGTSLSVDH